MPVHAVPVCPHLIQIADHCVACMQAVRPGLQCFRYLSYSNNPTLLMPIPHKGGLDSHVTPDAIEQTSVVVDGVFTLHEVLADNFWHCFHFS